MSELTPEQIYAAHREIQEHEIVVDALEEQIRSLLTEVQKLRKEQQQRREAINQCKGAISLLRRIPEDILIQIFEHCVQDGWTLAPVVVSGVSRAWRKAARAPRVWSHVYVDFDSPKVLWRVRSWLANARQAPLHITLTESWNAHGPLLHEVMDMLVQHIPQWHTLSVESRTIQHANALFSYLTGPAANLREVDIVTEFHFHNELDGEHNDIISLQDAFKPEYTPNLSRIRYESNVLPATAIFPPHIHDLHLKVTESPSARALSAASIIMLLESLPSLRSLSLEMPLFYEQPFVPEIEQSRTVTLPDLESLTLYGPTDLNEVLHHFRCPALRFLYLRSLEEMGYRQEPIGPSLLNFIQGSQPPLELLELHDIDLTPAAFSASFVALSNLRELRLHESSISDETVRLLHGPGALCPRLSRLDLRWCGHLSGRALVELVRSRNIVDLERAASGGSGGQADPITEIGVINCCFVREQDILDLAALTVCRVVMREKDDYCRACDCCGNTRYRTRLRLRHMTNLSIQERASIHLII
ncbi:hypothetical protein OBBRIDRAFT_440041 [Obba rivulosa]|uniref:F-box domain-containing protein n=1 Tax=Obba rivulosa TaxID=1052685 RepID=A0A8E2J6L3_9APHY|nr:hypothetical protein OBBRIDRAFT_440041 [Obba rivulosa]